jgi:hypothetical protein
MGPRNLKTADSQIFAFLCGLCGPGQLYLSVFFLARRFYTSEQSSRMYQQELGQNSSRQLAAFLTKHQGMRNQGLRLGIQETEVRIQEAKSIKHLVQDFVFTPCAMPYALCGERSEPQRTSSHKRIVLLLLADGGLGRCAVIVPWKNQSVIGQS